MCGDGKISEIEIHDVKSTKEKKIQTNKQSALSLPNNPRL